MKCRCCAVGQIINLRRIVNPPAGLWRKRPEMPSSRAPSAWRRADIDPEIASLLIRMRMRVRMHCSRRMAMTMRVDQIGALQ